MNDDNIPTLNPYAITSVPEIVPVVPSSRSYGGIGRLAYFGYSFLAGMVYNIVLGGIASVSQGPETMLVLPMLFIYLGVLLWIVALRMTNVGYSSWWCLGMFVPIVNILVGVRCIACPEGYADHRKLDTPGKIIVGIFLGLFALVVISLVLSLGLTS